MSSASKGEEGAAVAIYDFSALNLLLVEDNAFIRGVLESLLRQFRVGQINMAVNGQEAIDYLKSLKGRSRTARGAGPDVVMSDLIMRPINGLLLLQWVREAPESPDRFMPFVMVSGAADQAYVTQARDQGVTEFLAKPFSATSVYRRFLEVIDSPRQFVATGTYFGPDRRRRSDSRGTERRLTRDEDVTIVHSPSKVTRPEDGSEVWYFRQSNRLREKVGGAASGEPGEIPAVLLERAEAELQRSALDFTDWARNYLGDLSTLCAETLQNPEGRRRHFVEINLLAHELRGQGSTFGYPLITTFAKMLYDASGKSALQDDSGVEIVKAHIDAMRAVVREKVSGDGGEIGQALLQSLEAAIAKNATKD